MGTNSKSKDSKGAFKNYIDRKGWVGDQSNFYAYKVNDLSFFPSLVYKG